MSDDSKKTAVQTFEAWMREEIARIPAALKPGSADGVIAAWKASPQYRLLEDPNFEKAMAADEAFAASAQVGLRAAFWGEMLQGMTGTYRAPSAEEQAAKIEETSSTLRAFADSLG